jgi:hypothetical protein
MDQCFPPVFALTSPDPSVIKDDTQCRRCNESTISSLWKTLK